MNIKTKFELDKKLFGINYDNQIDEIFVCEITIDKDGIWYIENEYGGRYLERDCFATYEEVQAECNRRNNENSIIK